MSNAIPFKIRFDWRVTALALLLLPIVLSLGFWQLDRAEEKRQLQALFAAKQQAGPVDITQLEPQKADLRYQPVSLTGHFIKGKNILLDNRIRQRRFGYEVVTPFQLSESEQIVLVNRGWIEGDQARRHLPEFVTPEGELTLRGDIHVPQGELLMLASEQHSGWPRVQQSLEVSALQDKFAVLLFPYSVRLHAESPGALTPSWMVVNIQPQKHTGYAVQWFAMGITLVLIALLGNTNAWAWLKSRKA